MGIDVLMMLTNIIGSSSTNRPIGRERVLHPKIIAKHDFVMR